MSCNHPWDLKLPSSLSRVVRSSCIAQLSSVHVARLSLPFSYRIFFATNASCHFRPPRNGDVRSSRRRRRRGRTRALPSFGCGTSPLPAAATALLRRSCYSPASPRLNGAESSRAPLRRLRVPSLLIRRPRARFLVSSSSSSEPPLFQSMVVSRVSFVSESAVRVSRVSGVPDLLRRPI